MKRNESNQDEDALLRKFQLRLLDIMVLVDQICRKEKLTYYLFGGSLLGAVRHKGFIPWDDDADIAMPRKDFEKLKKIVDKYLPSNLKAESYESDETTTRIILRIKDMDTVCEPIKKTLIDDSLFYGAVLDVFPLDNARKEYSIANWRRAFLRDVLETMAFRAGRHDRGNNTLKQKLANFFAKRKSRKEWCVLRDRAIQAHYREGVPYYINLGSHYSYKNQVFLKAKLDPPVKIEFEKHLLYAPQDFDYVLKKFYGENYMKPPKEQDRQGHFSKIKSIE